MGNSPASLAAAAGVDVAAASSADGAELSTPAPPPPGAVVMQERPYGALGLVQFDLTRGTPEIDAENRYNAARGGLCPPWGHTHYPDGSAITFHKGIEQLLKDPWPDAWLAIQSVLAQLDEITRPHAWGARPAGFCDCNGPCCGVLNACFRNEVVVYRGDTAVHQALAASAWIPNLNAALNPHGLAADLYLKSTYHIIEHTWESTNENGSHNHSTSYEAKRRHTLYLRIFLWSARAAQAAAQAAPQPVQMQVVVPPGVAGGHTISVVGPDGQQFNTGVPPGMMPGQSFLLHLPAAAAAAPPPTAPERQTLHVVVPPGVAPGHTIAAAGLDGKQYNMTVPDGMGPGQALRFQLPPDAAWWRSVEPPLGAGAPQGMDDCPHPLL